MYEESSNVWVDFLGNKLSYFSWNGGEPNGSMRTRFGQIYTEGGGAAKWDDINGSTERNVVCVKCSKYYPIPSRVAVPTHEDNRRLWCAC